MDFFSLLEKRHSIRSFQGKPVEDEKLQQVLDAVSTAPSAGDLKAYNVSVVSDSSQKEALAAAAFGQGFVAEAPVVLVFSADSGKSSAKYGARGELYSVQDATIACAYAQLAAAALELGSVWVGAFDESKVAKAIGLPAELRPVALLPLGHAGK